MSTITPMPEAGSTRQIVAAEVRALMGRHNRNQTQMALLLGISQSQMSKRLRGIVPFDIDEMAVLATSFGVTIGSLFGENTTAPQPGGPDGGLAVRHQGLEPRTRWYEANSADQQERHLKAA